MINDMFLWPQLRTGVLILCILVGALSCESRQSEQAAEQPSTQVNQDDAPNTDSSTIAAGPMLWTRNMRSWPDTVHWVLDSSFAYAVDDLRVLLRMTVSQDISRMRLPSERPLITEILMVVMPVPLWQHAKNLNLDSVVYYDPLENQRLPGQQMLSWQRGYDNATVRTEFLPNMAEGHRQSPELQEGQELHPTVFMSWDDRTIIVETPPLLLKYLRDIDTQPVTPGLPPDYRSTAPDLDG